MHQIIWRGEVGTLEFVLFLIIIVAIVLTAFLIGKFLRHQDMKSARSDAIDRSKSVILGEVYEKIVPLLPDFPYAPRDMVFLGKGIDYVVLDGLAQGQLKEIVFLEIKTGAATLNRNERNIRDVIHAGKVRYQEWRAK